MIGFAPSKEMVNKIEVTEISGNSDYKTVVQNKIIEPGLLCYGVA
jgi:hypothetical protein